MSSASESRTTKARETFLSQFPDEESKREHMRGLAKRSAASRVVLSGDEASALAAAYKHLREIAHRLPDPDSQPTTDGTDRAA